MTDRQYLLARCLRLEARILTLKQDLADARPKRRILTDADRTAIWELRQQGRSPRQIAVQTRWSLGTVYNVFNTARIERTVGYL